MKKKYLKIIIIVFLIGLMAFGIKFAISVVKEKIFFNQIKDIEYDVKITKHSKALEYTGAYSVNYNVINLEERKLYSIWYSSFMGHERLNNYGVKTKELTQEDVQEILKLSNMESEEIDKNWNLSSKSDRYYWEIVYKERKVELDDLPFSEEVLKIK